MRGYKKFINHELYNTYDRLIIFIIGEQQKSYTTEFDTQSKFSFDKEKDIWDDNYLIKEIYKLEDILQLEAIKDYLEKNLSELKFPERLFDADIKICVQILKRDFGSSENIETNFKRGDDEFIRKKNNINNVSWDFFKEKIKGHLKYNKKIVEFLSDPINRELQKDYFEVSKAIQDFYKDNKNEFSTFENVFRAVFNKLKTYDDDEVPGLNIKIKILLHNMYFNCDIGTNPTCHD